MGAPELNQVSAGYTHRILRQPVVIDEGAVGAAEILQENVIAADKKVRVTARQEFSRFPVLGARMNWIVFCISYQKGIVCNRERPVAECRACREKCQWLGWALIGAAIFEGIADAYLKPQGVGEAQFVA